MLEVEDRVDAELIKTFESVVVIVLDNKSVDEFADEVSAKVELVVVKVESDNDGVVDGLYNELVISTLTTSLEGNSDDVELAVGSDVANELELNISVNVADEMSGEMLLSVVSRLVDDEMYESEVTIELGGVEVTELDARELPSKMLADESDE